MGKITALEQNRAENFAEKEKKRPKIPEKRVLVKIIISPFPNYSSSLISFGNALQVILGPSGAATRLPGPKNLFFLKLALFISELLLELPGAPGVSLELSWVPSSLQGCPRLPQARGNLSRLNARIPPPHNAPPGDP